MYTTFNFSTFKSPKPKIEENQTKEKGTATNPAIDGESK